MLKTSDDVQLHFTDQGAGRPVVLIHGWPLSGAMWEYQVGPLVEAGYRVITYDRRGFGKSSQPWDGYDYDTMAADLKTLIDQLDLKGVTLVGFSMGGGEVARYLGRYGAERIAQAVLVSAVTPFMLQTDDNPAGVPKETFAPIMEGLKTDRPHFLAGFSETFFGKTLTGSKVSKEMLETSLVVAMQASPRATIECAKAFGTTDFRPDMPAFSIPTLIIHGTADKTVPIDASARQAIKLVPGAILKEYDGEPHGLHITAMERLNSDLIEFLGRSA